MTNTIAITIAHQKQLEVIFNAELIDIETPSCGLKSVSDQTPPKLGSAATANSERCDSSVKRKLGRQINRDSTIKKFCECGLDSGLWQR